MTKRTKPTSIPSRRLSRGGGVMIVVAACLVGCGDPATEPEAEPASARTADTSENATNPLAGGAQPRNPPGGESSSGNPLASKPPADQQLTEEDRERIEAEAQEHSETSGHETDGMREGLDEVDRNAGWKTFRHALGPYFDHPGDWTIQESQYGYVLVPPDMKQGSELAIVFGEDGGGLTDPAAPEVGASLDQIMQAMEPGLRRTGSTESLRTRDGAGARFTYKGNLADGRTGTARLYTTVLGRYIIALALVATDEQLKARDATIQQIFTTFGMGQPKRDAQVVGAWRSEENEFSSSPSGSVSVNTIHTFAFAADGTVEYVYRSHVGADVTDVETGNPLAGGSGDGRDISRGTWVADAGTLTITWDNGNIAEYAYRFVPEQGAMLLQRSDQSKPRTYRRR